MPIFDYQVAGPLGATEIDRNADIPVGGAANSMEVKLTIAQPSQTVVLVRRNRLGAQRGTKEIRLAMKSRVSGNTAAGIILDLSSAISDRVRTTDIRNRNGYALEMDPNNEDKLILKKGMLADSAVVFTGTGLVTDAVNPRVGPGNWNHLLMQLQFHDDGTVQMKIRKTTSAVNAVTPTWVRVTGLPDIELGKFDVRAPGWVGLYGRGTSGTLARFNTVSLSDTLTVL